MYYKHVGFLVVQVAGQTPVPLPMPSTSGWDDPITVATLVIAASTVVSLLVSVLMWKAMRRQTQVTQNIFEAAHRPYVGVTELGGVMSHAVGSVRCGLTVLIKNSGSVPAYNLRVIWRVRIGDVIVHETPSIKKTIVLLPGEVNSESTNYSLTAQTYSTLAGEEILRILAVIEYEGVTDKKYSYSQHAEYDQTNDRGYVMTESHSS